MREGRANVVSVVGTETSVGLPPASIDLAFLCDVYHHFDHPREMLASIHRALRPNGRLFVVDYRREAGEPALAARARARGRRRRRARDRGGGFTLVSRDESLRDSYAVTFRRDTAP